MKALLLGIFTLLFSVQVTACECSEYSLEKLDQESYAWSDVIVIGDIIKTGTKYKIEVSEVLRGQVQKETLEGFTELDEPCTFYPSRKGTYIIYLRKIVIEDSTYYYSSECLGSRLLNLAYYPVSLKSNKSKEELLDMTNSWIDELRKRKS